MALVEEIRLLQTGRDKDTVEMKSVKREGEIIVNIHVVSYCRGRSNFPENIKLAAYVWEAIVQNFERGT